MELNLARLIYEHMEPPPKPPAKDETAAILERLAINLGGPVSAAATNDVAAVQFAIEEEGFMVQLVA